ncbi:MAG: hypothetical protein B1H02_07070 [Candidatus Latescibacteria bacterium 4484_107]|nr:MAG: hypothetical protein B1H02_07070 [Candidatus Latescibacteria bacterium 4484_107]
MIHIHSIHSDGSGTMPQIIEAGQLADLDFLIVTDHDTLEAKAAGWEGWHERLLVLVGEEVASQNQHCLALGLEAEIGGGFLHRRYRRGHRSADPEPPRRILERIGEQDGLSFIVHPHGRYRPFFSMRSYEWKEWGSDRFDGMEIWSYMFDWVRHFRFYKFRKFYRDPDAQITGPFPETLAMWDRLCRTRRIVGIAGVDAHAKTKRTPFGTLVVFPYKKLFRTIRTHILSQEGFSGQWADDARIVYRALREGHCFGAYDLLSSSEGFRFLLRSECGTAMMGDEMPFCEDAQIEIVVPRRASIRLLRNGKEIRRVEGDSLRFRAKTPGVYRTEVALGGRPWIYSNPIYFWEEHSRPESGDW